MLHFMLGPDHKGTTQALFAKLLSHTAAGEGGQILLVPEQISFETERQLCKLGGDSICRYAEVLSFSRLADRVSSEYGGVAARYLDQGGRLLAAAQAVEQVLSRIKLYASVCRKPEFLETFLQAADEFANYGVTAQMLTEASKRASGQFAQKLEELAILYESYRAVTAQAQDPVCRLQHLRDLLRDEDYAAGKSFYLCGFTDFTLLEQEIVQELILAADEVTIALDVEFSGRVSVFPSAEQTTNQLEKFCNANNVPLNLTMCDFKEGMPEDLAFLQCSVTDDVIRYYQDKIENVTCASLPDRDCECRNAILTIRKLVKRGARYRDIAIACQDPQTLPLLQSMLRRAEIPYFVSGRDDVLGHSGTQIVLTALRSAALGMDRDDVTDYLKSSGTLTEDESDRLENYAILWNIHGSRWEEEWTFHPQELTDIWKPEDRELLSKLNAWRETAVAPLRALRLKLAGAETVGEMAEAVYDFMTEIRFFETMQSRAERLYDDGDFLLAQQTSQICEILQNALSQMDLILHDCVRTPEEFYRLFEKLVSRYTVSAIPAASDRVSIGTASDYRAREIPHLIILDADDAHFPAPVLSNSLISEDERRQLASENIRMAPPRTDAMDRELGGIYQAIRAASASLTIFYTGESASYITQRIARFCGKKPYTATLLPLSDAEAAATYLRYNAEAASPAIAEEADALRAGRDYEFGPVSAENVSALYGKEIRLSASRIDKFCSCRFAFFMNYGLKAKPRTPVTFNASAFGTFVHKILEDTARAVMERGGFQSTPWDEVAAIAQEAIKRYQAQTLCSLMDVSARFSQTFLRNCDEAMAVLRDMANELEKSKFEPFDFELHFADDGTLPAVRVAGENASCCITGFVDRVDVYRDGGETFVRVVDYKTGHKDFDYADLQLGMGMQMLIYLFALKRYGAKAFGEDLHPAGVLYLPARQDYKTEASKPTPEKAAKAQIDLHRRKGLILNEDRIIHAMEDFVDAPQYLPISKKGGDVLDRAEMERLERYVFAKLGEITDAIAGGEIAPNPIVRSVQDSACTYCDFKSVCHKDFTKIQERPIKSMSNSQFFSYLASWEDSHG
ncbi:MAG: PD-(D/E)XK nuclease family protein [Oscillospiraceae bacterium]|nr:PD-(D/E)XK nuclease family protein [Oscillospiraceae bacterium]